LGRIAGPAWHAAADHRQDDAELQAALKTPEVREKLPPTGIKPAGGSVANFATFIAGERKRLGDIALKAKMGEP
jgi:tripartite-type tricarboxylate transporter receptor subunit TctC